MRPFVLGIRFTTEARRTRRNAKGRRGKQRHQSNLKNLRVVSVSSVSPWFFTGYRAARIIPAYFSRILQAFGIAWNWMYGSSGCCRA